nr:sugar transferase [Desulfosporosinus acididurans]
MDLFIINLSYIAIFILKSGQQIPGKNFSAYLHVAPWICLAAVLVFYVFDLYNGWLHRDLNNVIYSLILALIITNLLAMGLLYLTQAFAMPRSVSILAPVLEAALLALYRLFLWYFHKRFSSTKRVIVIGKDAQEAMMVANKFSCHAKGRFEITMVVYTDDIKKIESRIKQKDHDIVAINSTLLRKGRVIDICIKEHKEIFMVPDITAVLLNSSDTCYVDDTLMFALKPPGIKPGQKLLKRTFDIICSLIFLGILSPVMIFIALIIHITSPGSALFKQERLGENGKSFEVFKFRSMVNNAEKLTGPVLAIDRDPRITKFGSFLRATRLDEIPQFINVLQGDMSLVGPRPEREFFVSQFSDTIPYYRYRMEVKPGITGLAQVMGKYTTSAEDKLRFDLMYIRNYSILMDLKILLLTARVVFQRDKAAGVENNMKAVAKT